MGRRAVRRGFCADGCVRAQPPVESEPPHMPSLLSHAARHGRFTTARGPLAALVVALVAGLLPSGTAFLPGPAAAAAAGTISAPRFQPTTVFSGLTQPISFAFAPDGRVFVAEKSGIIKIFDNLADTSPT